MKRRPKTTETVSCLMALAAVALTPCVGRADVQTAVLRSDRAAVERVYYDHRLGEKPPFEKVLPDDALDKLVRQDLRKEAVLKKYGVEITPAMLDVEVERINTTTRAPAMLAKIKSVLGNDPARFARAVARPTLVDRLLREKFDNDDALHAPQRQEMERVRTGLTHTAAVFRSSRGIEAPADSGDSREQKAEIVQRLLTSVATNELVEKLLAQLKQTHSNFVTETTWQLGAPTTEKNAPTTDEIEIKKRFGPDAQILASPRADGNVPRHYFEDLPRELQTVLRAQLRQPGDVSAVIEMPHYFLLYVANEKTSDVLSVGALSLPKRDYEQWLVERTNLTEK